MAPDQVGPDQVGPDQVGRDGGDWLASGKRVQCDRACCFQHDEHDFQDAREFPDTRNRVIVPDMQPFVVSSTITPRVQCLILVFGWSFARIGCFSGSPVKSGRAAAVQIKDRAKYDMAFGNRR